MATVNSMPVSVEWGLAVSESVGWFDRVFGWFRISSEAKSLVLFQKQVFVGAR